MVTGITDDAADVPSPVAPTIFIISDIRLVRDGLSSQLQRDGRLSPTGAGPPDSATIDNLVALAPCSIALDLSFSGALDFAEQLRARFTRVKLIGFAIGECDPQLAAWARTGVCGYVDKEGSAEDIVQTVLHALKGELYCSPRLGAQLVAQLSATIPRPRVCAKVDLTPREAEILEEIRFGASNKEIARQLGISAATVKNHVHHVLEKLSVNRRGQASALMNGFSPQV
jgi:DNA-binding NarL/FixJ family response regulator